MATILVVEDEVDIGNLIRAHLEADGHTVHQAFDGPGALALVEAHSPQLIILDWMLPGLDGLAVCRRIREAHLVPIIMLTARAEEIDRVLGLEAGADDYVVKPFRPAELRSRIRAVLRRSGTGGRVESVLSAGPITLDPGPREVRRDGETIALTFSEFELLQSLMSDPKRVHSRHDLLRAIWGDSAYRDPRAIDVHVRHLREKLEAVPEDPQLIVTVRGAGYRIGET